ncbi:MAG: bifunctional folylpolyglutamate synthase/dihydrofolate synthase [Chitinophagaceae bacterium]|nr:bifunctional folylpolyglutamate synthase/dihydrofolate synthase [Chitinophagaceae bacterium]MCW5904990.1 bifunctional folylpolyglutamate synthase/dihydrofolate synthase [Chitinophagaceae bacterium]
MNYQQTLAYLFDKLPMYSKMGKDAYKADLSNTIRLCAALNNPHLCFPSIHIAGTNGKGSVSHTIAAILQTAGCKTGLYTSPHLKDFRERIKINGNICSEEFVISFTQQIQPIINEIQPSFFEITVAMAFKYFAQEKVDIAIIETGLGGRLDSTNIITPQLSVITNIGFDHIQILGNTLEKIAFEKAGIIKQNTPIVIGEMHEETKKVFDKIAREKNAPIFYAQNERKVVHFAYNHSLADIIIDNNHLKEQHIYTTDLTGIYQTKNILTVLCAIEQLQKLNWHITEQNIKEGIKNVQKITAFKGRWQLLQTQPTVIADVAHNEDGIKQVIEQLTYTSYHKLHIIIGMVKDKDVSKVLSLLPTSAIYYFTQAPIPRALPTSELFDLAQKNYLTGNKYDNVNQAINAAKKNATNNDLILVIGSVFLVGDIEIL